MNKKIVKEFHIAKLKQLSTFSKAPRNMNYMINV